MRLTDNFTLEEMYAYGTAARKGIDNMPSSVVQQNLRMLDEKALRRTFNKVVDYMCYLMIAGVLGMAIGEPMGLDHVKIAVVVMLLCCAWELDSVYGHICILNGAEKDFSVRKFIVSLLKRKHTEIDEATEEARKTVSEEQVKEARKLAGHIKKSENTK